ncbi:MAG TPA: isoaspartyl peptidase/L-asparaginase family protein [Spirochaetia bacterium]|nr:isoaspartyl peptidase/L-asparaginase family protein [Spirochaetia bacterium]
MLSQWLTESPDPRFVVQVHGGAWNIPADLKGPHTDGVHHAYDAAMHALGQGQRPLDVVVSTLRILEDDPTFDAGTGSFLNEDGKVELDAALMEGKNLRAGAVASIGRFRNPSEIARAVMERTEHVLLIAEGAERFALSAGFVPVDPESLVDPRERMGFQAWVAAGKPDARTFFDEEGRVNAGGSPSDHERRGTVGVVIGVRVGPGTGYSVYAGASTGGTRGKMAGRVGDVPLVGCGIYADDEGAAVCCTGWGEAFIRMAAAKSVSDRAARGEHPQEAVEAVLRLIHRRTGGRGGIIAVDARGRRGAAFTTPDMGYAGQSCTQLML